MSEIPAWLAPALSYIPIWLAHQMRVTEQPGCGVAITQRGQVVLDSVFGSADLAAGEKLTPRHRFRVASHSKTFTAAAMLKLREQGRLKLDDTAGQYVDGLHPQIAAATLVQLLSHSAGIFRDGTDSAYWAGRAPFSAAARIRHDLKLPPVIDANTRLKYSNHGFALAGMVIEGITGEPYGTWVQREIVEQAGLTETTPDVPLPAGTRLARGHGGRLLLAGRPVFPGDQSTHALASATGFVSTAADLARFFAQLSPTAPSNILSADSRREMTRPQWRDEYSVLQRSYGLGIVSGTLNDWHWFGHSGGFQGYITRTAVIPAHDIAISVLTNASDGMSHEWLDGAISILQAFHTHGAPTTAAARWTGRWWSVWGATDLVAMGNKVLLALPVQTNPFHKVPELAITGDDTARIALSDAFGSYGEPARLVRSKSGKLTEVHIASGRLVSEQRLARELEAKYEIAKP